MDYAVTPRLMPGREDGAKMAAFCVTKRRGLSSWRRRHRQGSGAAFYDRQLLLLGPKRNRVLDLREVLRYGTDSYGDPSYVSIY